jgi:hypothetical protein
MFVRDGITFHAKYEIWGSVSVGYEVYSPEQSLPGFQAVHWLHLPEGDIFSSCAWFPEPLNALGDCLQRANLCIYCMVTV